MNATAKSGPAREGRRELLVPVATMCTAAGFALLAARGQRVTVEGAEVSGANTPAAAALALVSLAGASTLLLLGRTGRRFVGLLLLVVGGAIVVVMLVPADTNTWFTYGAVSGSERPDFRRSAWAWAGAGSGLVLMLAAVWIVVRSRHASNRLSPAVTGTAAGEGPDAAASPRATWDRIDRGEDPTV